MRKGLFLVFAFVMLVFLSVIGSKGVLAGLVEIGSIGVLADCETACEEGISFDIVDCITCCNGYYPSNCPSACSVISPSPCIAIEPSVVSTSTTLYQTVNVKYDGEGFATTDEIYVSNQYWFEITISGNLNIIGNVKAKAVSGEATVIHIEQVQFFDAYFNLLPTVYTPSATWIGQNHPDWIPVEIIAANVPNTVVSKFKFRGWTNTGGSASFVVIFPTLVEDKDGDGYTNIDDCADNDPTIYPGAPEICDGKANDQEWHDAEERDHCEAAQGVYIDSGCDTDLDDFCDSAMNVSLTWLAKCSVSTEPQGEGCCSKTWDGYRSTTGSDSPSGVYDTLKSYDLDIQDQLGSSNRIYWATKKKIPPTATIYTYFARGNDCGDNLKTINPGETEKCYSNEKNVADDDCDDGTNAMPLYEHWDVDGATGVNEGCEDDNNHDCDLYGHYWIGGIDDAGSCCGNNTYALSDGFGYKTDTEFFPYWDTTMAAYPFDSFVYYQYSGCWDSLPLQNDEISAANLLWASIPEAPVLAKGRDYYYATVSNEGEIDLTEEAVNISSTEPNNPPTPTVYTLRMNVSLESDQPTVANLRYMVGTPAPGGGISWGSWKEVDAHNVPILQVISNKGWKIKGFNYTAPASVKQIKLQMHLIGGGTLKIKDAAFYNAKDVKVLNVNGTFRGCDVPGDSWVTNQVNTYNPPVPVILSQYYTTHDAASPDNCSTASDYYCSYAGYWKRNVDGIQANNLSDIPETEEDLRENGYFENIYTEKDCCPTSYCWDGIKCNNGNSKFVGVNLANITITLKDGTDEIRNYKCVDGVWQNATLKPDQDNLTTGYCGQYQCFYRPPNSASLCVNDKNYTFDDYCLQGQWTSRTNLIATQLIDLVKKDSGSKEYTLFCDSFKDALNDYDYRDIEAGDVVPYLLGQNTGDEENPAYDCGFGEYGCTNNFCVLKYTNNDNKEKVVFGTSLNLPINVSGEGENPISDLSFLRLINALTRNKVPNEADHYTYCDGVIRQQKDYYLGCTHKLGDKDYVEDQDWDLWYNAKTQSIIYSPQKINLGSYSFWDSFVGFIKNPFTSIINFILGMEREGYTGNDYALVKDIGKFRRLYINDDFQGGKLRTIKGFIEKVGAETAMVVDYQLIGMDICRKVDDYNKKYFTGTEGTGCEISSTLCPLTCEPSIYELDNWSFHVESMNEDGFALWPDLTAKIRLNGPVQAPTSGGDGGLDIYLTTG